MNAEPAATAASPTVSRWFALRHWFRERRAAALGIALAMVVCAGALRLFLGPAYPAPFIPFYPAILVGALIGGRLPGYFALCASLCIAAWIFEYFPGPAVPTNVPIALLLFALVASTVIELLSGLTTLAERLQEREGVLIGRAKELEQRELQTAVRLAELEAIYEQAPIGLGFLDADLRFLRINPALAEMNGHPAEDHVGNFVWDLVPDLRDAAEPVLQRVLAGETIRNVELSGETAAMPGVRRHWVELFYPVRGADGRSQGVGILCEEVTEAHRAREREELLMREVDHRAKNLLAVVQSVVQLTRYTGDAAAFKAAVVGRIQALGRVHALLSDSRWEGVQLDEIVRQEAAPFEGAMRVTPLAVPLQLAPGAAQAISMVLHELITNSVKYGALSGTGHVDLACNLGAEDDPAVTLEWHEVGGPPVAKSGAGGFGTQLIRTAVKGTLRGELDYRLEPQGVICIIRFPKSACAVPA